MKKRHLLAVTVLVAVVAGCGDGDGDDSNKQLSYAATGTKLSAICTKAKAAAGNASLTGDLKADAKTAEKIKSALDDGLDEVNDVKPPDELKSAYDDFKSQSEQQSQKLQDALDAADSGDKDGFDAALKEYGALNQQNNLSASQLGAKGCIG
jgi:hypothetical protein